MYRNPCPSPVGSWLFSVSPWHVTKRFWKTEEMQIVVQVKSHCSDFLFRTFLCQLSCLVEKVYTVFLNVFG